MSTHYAKLRKQVGYEKNVPRCETCVSYRKPFVFLIRDSRTGRSEPGCKLYGFNVKPHACCNSWRNEKGETVETG